MSYVKSTTALIISMIILSVSVENVPTLKNTMNDLFSGVSISLPDMQHHSASRFPLSLDAGILSSNAFSIEVGNVENLSADLKNASIIFDDRQIVLNPSLLQTLTLSGYSGKLLSNTINGSLQIDGSAKGIVSSTLTITSQRSVKVSGNITSNSITLSNVVDGSVFISNAIGKAIYNDTNSVSLLGDNVKINSFNGQVSIGSYGVTLNGTAGYLEVKSSGRITTVG